MVDRVLVLCEQTLRREHQASIGRPVKVLIDAVLHKVDTANDHRGGRQAGTRIGCALITSLSGWSQTSSFFFFSFFYTPPSPTVRTVQLETPCLNYKEPL